MTEVIYEHMNQIEDSKVLDKLNLEKGKYILLSSHREENIDLEDKFIDLMNAVNNIAEKSIKCLLFILSIHGVKMD